MPIPIQKDWIRELWEFPWPQKHGLIRSGTVCSFLDLSLELANREDSLAILKYAIKIAPLNLDPRGKRLFVQQSVNLALRYPYLARILGRYVFDKYHYNGIEHIIFKFVVELLEIGIHKIYPDAIVYALYYSLKYNLSFDISKKQFEDIFVIDDCFSYVLLREYAKRHKSSEIRDKVRRRADKLKKEENRERDRFWLLIYQVWQAKTLRNNDQEFLADLKQRGFKFVEF